MTFPKSLWTDLVEKKLWPVALVLLLALIAVPVALGGGGSDAVDTPLGATGATGAAAGTLAQVSLDAATPQRRDRLGKVRDPFTQRATKGTTGPSGATGAATGTTGGGGGAATPAAADTGTTGGGGSTTPTVPKETTPAPKVTPSYTTTVRLARVTAKTRPAKRITQLTPLPSIDNPFLAYLGVLENGKTAVFLLSSDVTSEGDGTCKPRRSSCETVEVDQGEAEVLSVTGDDGTVKRYQLDVVAVQRTGTTTTSPSVATVKKQEKAASKVAPEDELGTDSYSVDDESGLLKRVKATSGLGAHLPGDGEAKAIASLRSWIPTGAALEPMPDFQAGG